MKFVPMVFLFFQIIPCLAMEPYPFTEVDKFICKGRLEKAKSILKSQLERDATRFDIEFKLNYFLDPIEANQNLQTLLEAFKDNFPTDEKSRIELAYALLKLEDNTVTSKVRSLLKFKSDNTYIESERLSLIGEFQWKYGNYGYLNPDYEKSIEAMPYIQPLHIFVRLLSYSTDFYKKEMLQKLDEEIKLVDPTHPAYGLIIDAREHYNSASSTSKKLQIYKSTYRACPTDYYMKWYANILKLYPGKKNEKRKIYEKLLESSKKDQFVSAMDSLLLARYAIDFDLSIAKIYMEKAERKIDFLCKWCLTELVHIKEDIQNAFIKKTGNVVLYLLLFLLVLLYFLNRISKKVKLNDLSKSKKRSVSGVCFGVFGFLSSGIIYLASRDPFGLVILPTIASTISGFILGSQILLNDNIKYSLGKSLVYGIITTLFSHILFGVFYFIYLGLASPDYFSPAFAPIAIVFSVLLAGVYTIPSGIFAALILFMFNKKQC